MANELLDFVMALVRDPAAAAAYNADPAQAIADAHLTDVSSVDVNNLIPVVSESLSTAMPGGSFDSIVDSNVWASGAATEAFDSFSAPALDQPAHDAFAIVTDTAPNALPDTVSAIDVPADPGVSTIVADDSSLQALVPDGADFPVDSVLDAAQQSAVWEHASADAHLPDSLPDGLDIFDQ